MVRARSPPIQDAVKVITYTDYPHRLAGSQKSLALSLSRIGDYGVQPIVVVPTDGILVEHCRKLGIEVHVLPAPPAFQTFGRTLTRLSAIGQMRVVATETLPYSIELVRFADRVGAEVIHFNTPRGLVMAGWAPSLASRPTVTHLRGVPMLGKRYWLAAQALGDTFVLVAKTLEQYFLPSVVPRCRTVYNGVIIPDPIDRSEARASVLSMLDRKQIDTTRIRAALDDGAMLCVALSSLTPFKGLHHLIDAAALVKARGAKVVYLAAGVGLGDDYEKWVQAKKTELGLDDHFHFVGFIEDPTQMLASADIAVLPSVQEETLSYAGRTEKVEGTEGLPRTILESFAVGVPVISSDIAGVREQLEDGEGGLLVPPADAAALANAIVRATEDPAWRERAGKIGHRTVRERFSVDKAAEGLAAVFREPKPRLTERARGWAEVARESSPFQARPT